MTDDQNGSDLAVELSKLTALRNRGAITAQEFETAKQQLLSQSPVAAEGLTLEDLHHREGADSASPPPDEGADVTTSDPPRGAEAPGAPAPQPPPRAADRIRADLPSGGSLPRVVWLAGGGGLCLVVLLVALLVGLRGKGCGAGHGGEGKSSSAKAGAAGDTTTGPGGAARWRPGAPFSCGALQDRVDGCEEEWVDQLELLLKRKGILVGKARISVDRPQIAVKQAQTLVFERGELHRCQVAQKLRRPAEVRWLDAVKRCFEHKQRRRFTICHVKAFLEHIGLLPFSCRFYCNKEMYQCGAEVVASSLRKQRGFRGRVDDDRLDKVRPRLFTSCLRYCKQKLKSAKTREAVLQCMFQPTCKGFVGCLERVPVE